MSDSTNITYGALNRFRPTRSDRISEGGLPSRRQVEELASMLPVVGAPVSAHLAAEDVGKGDYLSGGLNALGALTGLPLAKVAAVIGVPLATLSALNKVATIKGVTTAPSKLAKVDSDQAGALMFHASPNWWKDLQFNDEFLKSGEGQTVKGLGHYTTGSPSHAWDRYNLKLGGDRVVQGYALGPLTAANLPSARREFVKTMRDVSEIDKRLDAIKSLNPNMSDKELQTLRDAVEDVFARDLAKAEAKMKLAALERKVLPQRPNVAQGNILAVNTKRPFSEYVNWAGDVLADKANDERLWRVVKGNPRAEAVYDSNVTDTWGDMIKGLEARFGERNTANILSSAGIAGNLHPNMLSRKFGGLEHLSAKEIGRAVDKGILSPEHFNASTVSPADLEVLKRYKSLESLESDLPTYTDYQWDK